jgi:hypothetical protein
VAPDLPLHAELGGAALNYAPGIDPIHRGCGERAGPGGCGAEEGVRSRIQLPILKTN